MRLPALRVTKYRLIVIIFLLGGFMFLQCIGVEEDDSKATEVWEPVPEVVTPGEGTKPPSDAIVLFDGKDLSQWVHLNGDQPKWAVKDGIMTVVPKSGDIITRQGFGDCQLHVGIFSMGKQMI